MEQILELDPGHVRTREHFEAMVAEFAKGRSGAMSQDHFGERAAAASTGVACEANSSS